MDGSDNTHLVSAIKAGQLYQFFPRDTASGEAKVKEYFVPPTIVPWLNPILDLPDDDLLIPWPFDSQDLTYDTPVRVFHGIVISNLTAHMSYVDLRARVKITYNLIDDIIPDHLRSETVYVDVPLYYFKVLQPKMWNVAYELEKGGNFQCGMFSIEITSEMVSLRDINYERAVAHAKLPTKKAIIQRIVDDANKQMMELLPAGLHCACQLDGQPMCTTPHPSLKLSGHLHELQNCCNKNGHGFFRHYSMDFSMIHCQQPMCHFLASANTMRLCSVVENLFVCASCYTALGKVRDSELSFIPLSTHPPCPSTGKYKNLYKQFRKRPTYDENNISKYGFVCKGCQHVRYCSKECQRNHWHAHKPYCHLEKSVGSHFRRSSESGTENEVKKLYAFRDDDSYIFVRIMKIH